VYFPCVQYVPWPVLKAACRRRACFRQWITGPTIDYKQRTNNILYIVIYLRARYTGLVRERLEQNIVAGYTTIYVGDLREELGECKYNGRKDVHRDIKVHACIKFKTFF